MTISFLTHTIIVESTLQLDVYVPVMQRSMWTAAVQELEQILQSHEEIPQEGTRYRIGHYRSRQTHEHSLQMDIVYFDFILTRKGDEWEHIISVWRHRSPYEYDFDVFEMYTNLAIYEHPTIPLDQMY